MAATGLSNLDQLQLDDNLLKLKNGSYKASVVVATLAADRTLTVPDPGAAASFVMTAGAQTISGNLTLSGTNTYSGAGTFSGANTFSGVQTFNSGKFALRDTANDNSITVQSAGDEAANRTLSIPLLGANDTLMTLGTAQAVTGVKTVNDGSIVMKAGTGSETFLPSGTVNVQTNQVATGANTTETDAHSKSLGGNTLSGNNKCVRGRAWGTTAANANNKTLQLYFGGTSVYTTGAVAANAKNWELEFLIVRTGVGAQKLYISGHFNGTPFVSITTATKDETAAQVIKTTLTNGAASAADITEDGFILEVLP